MAGTDVWRAFVTRMEALPTQIYAEAMDLMAALTNMAQVQVGTYTGTGVALDVSTDGDPRFVLLVNITQQALVVHSSGMTAAHALIASAVATKAIAADGITLGTGKFTIGVDAELNTLADSGFWCAII